MTTTTKAIMGVVIAVVALLGVVFFVSQLVGQQRPTRDLGHRCVRVAVDVRPLVGDVHDHPEQGRV